VHLVLTFLAVDVLADGRRAEDDWRVRSLAGGRYRRRLTRRSIVSLPHSKSLQAAKITWAVAWPPRNLP